jgi:ABC-type lipoprotein release transport system permease subunit
MKVFLLTMLVICALIFLVAFLYFFIKGVLKTILDYFPHHEINIKSNLDYLGREFKIKFLLSLGSLLIFAIFLWFIFLILI